MRDPRESTGRGGKRGGSVAHNLLKINVLRAHAALVIWLAAAACARPSAEAPPVPVADDAAADSLLVDVRSLDSTIVVRMRYAGTRNFTGAPLPGYDTSRAFLRHEAATALARVQASLRPDSLGLLVWDAYRPVSATEGMVAWAERTGNMKLFRQGYIARRSRHNMGVAVDLTLIDLRTGSQLEMGTSFDTFSKAAQTASARGAVAINRQRLVQAMAAEGFVNYEQEWWHYSIEVPNPMPFNVPVR